MKTAIFLLFSLFLGISEHLHADESLQARLKREMDKALTLPRDLEAEDFALDENGDLVETTQRVTDQNTETDMSDSVSLGQAGLRRQTLPQRRESAPTNEKEGSFKPPRRRSR